MAGETKDTLPVDNFALARCPVCASTRLVFSKSIITRAPLGDVTAKRSYCRCKACGRKSRAIFS